jgi:hypothetical protein
MEKDQTQKKYIVRLYDGFDREWFDVYGPANYEDARHYYNEKTCNNTKYNNFRDYIDYYGFFEV